MTTECMSPIQIGIKKVIAQSPDGTSLYTLDDKQLQIAYLQQEQIYVDQIDVKTINHMLK